ncbi:MAG: HDOD domain-containing protein [Thermodesulfobacteriota bacterium]
MVETARVRNGLKRILVAPGELKVSADHSMTLETHLGSCVGVALYDRKATVGGLIHIMLPGGARDKAATAPSRYAVSGIPLLVAEMEKLGASKHRIAAAIAGGALILTDQKLSVDMNIGRKNSIMAKEVLKALEISIISEDTGGNFARTFGLDLATGKTEVKAANHRKDKIPFAGIPAEIRLSDLRRKIDKLKPVSEIARQVISRIEYATCDINELEKIIMRDQALTANVLKICNSSYYGLQQQISSIAKAVIFLGLKTLKNIVLTACIYRLYEDTLCGYSGKRGELYKHSVCCAIVAELIAKQKNLEDPKAVFTAGLLHDIGKVILDQYVFERFNLIMDKVINEKRSFVAAEKELLGYDHTEVGGIVADDWRLPPFLVKAISSHHLPEGGGEYAEIVAAVHIADGICSMIGGGRGVDGLANRIHQEALSIIDLNEDDIDCIIEQLAEIVSRKELL